MSIISAIFLGIIEGATEFLPVSSTAHLLLASRIFHIIETEFAKSFTIAIQVGAIFAVVYLYRERFLRDAETLKRIAAAFLPTAVIGFVLYKFIKGFLFENAWVSIAALFIGGLFLIFFERYHTAQEGEYDLSTMPYRKAIIIGCAQAIAVAPGVSRAGATVVGGLLLGVPRAAIVEFSFLLAVPTMLAATAYDLLKNAGSFSGGNVFTFAVGFIVSFVVAIVAVRWLISFVSSHSFEPFGWYRIVLAILMAFVLLL